MSHMLNDSRLLAALLQLPRAATHRLAGARAGTAAGFAKHLAQLSTDANPEGERPNRAAEALAGLLDGQLWQQRGAMDAPPSVEPAAVPLPHVANTVATALYQGATRVHLQVMPPQLGAVDVTVHLQAGVMQVVMQTETSETLEALQKDLPALRETLRGAGLNIGALRLTLRRKTSTAQTPDEELSHDRS